MKVKIHSVIDLITNSSTEIFVYSENSIEPCKEMINEILSLQGSDKTCDDLFDLKITLDAFDIKQAIEYSCGLDIDFQEELLKNVDTHIKALMRGERPEWWKNIKYDIPTSLEIIPKEEKYNDLAKLIVKFLYSPRHEEHSWG